MAAAMIGSLSFAAWLYLVFAHGKFWQSAPESKSALPPEFPDVDIIIAARDEVESIGRVIDSLLAQDYTGKFLITVVDDESTDGTANTVRATGASRVIAGLPKPGGWSGKLWAMNQGVAASRAPLLLFTDADIVHDPRHLSALVARLLSLELDMVSEMVRLNCESPAERALVPAFVYFFQMLYPFAKVNAPRSGVAAAAGGTMLLRREALARCGGLEAIRGALIDDVALAKAVKRIGRIHLGHCALATSIRRYPRFADVWRLIARTAFTQLRGSAAVLGMALLGLALIWWVPAWQVLFGRGWGFAFGIAAFTLASLSYLPTLKRYGRTPLWSLALPLIASFYMAATLSSAFDHWRGAGARWKERVYGVGP